MRIKKIQLKNGYKRFHDLTIDLGDNPKRIIALVGSNGCGKSSVFDGMLYVQNSHKKMGNKGAKDYKYHSMNQITSFNYQNIELEFEGGNYSTVYQNKVTEGLQNTIFSFRSSYRYNNNLMITETKATSNIRENNYGASSACDIDDKMEENYRRLYIKYNEYLNSTDCRPTEAKVKIIGDLNCSISKCLDLEIESMGSIEDNKGSIYFKKPDSSSSFAFNVLSSGEKEVVDILLDLYLRQETYKDSIFIIDEPELHINTSIQRKLLIEINKLIGEDCQIWLATHSIGFLRALQNDFKDQCQIIHFPDNTNWASDVKVLKPIIGSRDKWKELFSVALEDLTDLISPKKIIYCEGKDMPGSEGREKGFDAQVFNNIFGDKYTDTLFISSGGNTELDKRSDIAIAILSKVFSEVEILVLKDRDVSSGRENSEKDRTEYLSLNPHYHRMLKRWEIENYLFDKEVLLKYCTTNNKEFDESNYDIYITDIKNQNIKDDIRRIRNFCNIIVSINSEQFKLNLSKLITPDLRVYQELENCIFYEPSSE